MSESHADLSLQIVALIQKLVKYENGVVRRLQSISC